MRPLLGLCLLTLLLIQCRGEKEPEYLIQFPGKPGVPLSIKKEHDELIIWVKQFTVLQDSTGRVAKKLFELMGYHFGVEEDYVLPPLELLPRLASGKTPANSENVIRLTEKLKTQLALLNAEHQLIRTYVEELKRTVGPEMRDEILDFEVALQKHAALEEEILFPAAIVAGEHLRLRAISAGNK